MAETQSAGRNQKLQIPILIVNGTKDIQISTQDAELLHKANPKSELVLIQNMNHIFKEIKGDDAENMATYTNPNLPVMPELIEKITTFLKKYNSFLKKRGVCNKKSVRRTYWDKTKK